MHIDQSQPLTQLHLPKKEGKQPLKRSLSGYELELFLLDSQGKVTDSSSILKKKLSGIKKECAKGMLEAVCMPHTRLGLTGRRFVEILHQVTDNVEQDNLHLYPYGTYPGQHQPTFWNAPRYTLQKKIFGVEKFKLAGMCCGFHQHYTLPRGLFNRKTKFLNYMRNSKLNRGLIDSYNLLIALDPIFTLFLQSSPFVNNTYLAKDSRVLLYRGGPLYKEGLYTDFQDFGDLPQYRQTVSDLMHTLERKHSKWKTVVEKHDFSDGSKKMLDYAWNALKINGKGTLEYRGGDANIPSIVLGVSTLIKFTLRKIQQDFMWVTPMDIDASDAFKTEGNMIFIPPQSLVRTTLQKESATLGMDSDLVYSYAQSFVKFAKDLVYKEYRPLLAPIETMLKKKQTVSDHMIQFAAKKGYKKKIDNAFASEMALHYSSLFHKDIINVQKNLESIE